MSLVIALSGRRIDAPGAPVERFPLENAAAVQDRLATLFSGRGATALVCSAACGSDLLALEAAGNLGLRRSVVLPFSRERFRQTSVTDRPGDWGAIYDRVLDAVEVAGDLVVLEDAGEGDPAYAAASEAILDRARQISLAADPGRGDSPGVLAVIVWEGKSRGDGDITAGFAALADSLRIPVVEVPT
jgi:hypothetical protein